MNLQNITNSVGGIEVVDLDWLPATRGFYDAMATAENRLTYQQTAALDVLIRAIINPLIVRITALENGGTTPTAPHLTLSSTGSFLTLSSTGPSLQLSNN